ncbi:hypothetical protein [Spiroplasma turonicum]|uniref:Restriction endonuclease n=1 Tax=Spiroplasma turonicum TaxID=216946 RepID=A0A0K1P6I3_9MOLU|nr:hypothetical protein [Spiroplasma turonicum]AKU79814.1 hypothetical protein STURON_00568 [Spiroplasma turonicum]ALX70832.1 hypothetical protein STURO_v1c05660 [Spiroplasma turonicum]
MSQSLLEKNLLNKIKEAKYNTSLESHIDKERSGDKVDDFHYMIAKDVSKVLSSSEYEVYSKYLDKKELSVEGAFYRKKTDVAIKNKSDDKILGTIEFKWLKSSIQKNINNAFSNMLGEVVNIKKNNIKTMWIFLIRSETPIYDKNFNILNLFDIQMKHFQKYIRAYDIGNDEVFLPNVLSFIIYKDNCNYKNKKSKRDILIEYKDLYNKENLIIEIDKNFNYNKNNLFFNNYENSINKFVEALKKWNY